MWLLRILIFSVITTVVISNSYCQHKDSIKVTFEAVVPENTPSDATIYWAGSLNKWDPGPYSSGFSAQDFSLPLQIKDNIWTTTLKAPRNTEVQWKYSRGSIYSSEENADYTYRQTRKVIFDTEKTIRDTIEAWHDIPPESIQNRWPVVQLSDTNLTFHRSGIEQDGIGTIIYDQQIGSRYFEFNQINSRYKKPASAADHVAYFIPISNAPQNNIFVLALKDTPQDAWEIYADKNNDRAVSPEEFLFDTKSKQKSWKGNVKFLRDIHGDIVTDSTEITVSLETNLPAGYQSTVHPEAPDLIYRIPFHHKKGVLNETTFHVTTIYGELFSKFSQISVDKNGDGIIETGSGSEELVSVSKSQMYRKQKFYIFPTFKLNNNWWEIASVDPYGDWIQLRPAQKKLGKAVITTNQPIPNWNASTYSGNKLSSDSLRGNFVLLNFWGSWCVPCIEAIPQLKRVYSNFSEQNFEIIGFAYDNKSSLSQALTKYNLPWPQILDDDGRYRTKFRIRSYPTYYLVDPKGKVVEMGSALRGKKLDQTLKRYLKD